MQVKVGEFWEGTHGEIFQVVGKGKTDWIVKRVDVLGSTLESTRVFERCFKRRLTPDQAMEIAGSYVLKALRGFFNLPKKKG